MGAKYKCFVYPNVDSGFAENDLDEYDQISAGLAWTRTLGLVRKAHEMEVDLESIWEEHVALEFSTKDADATMSTMVAEPYVNHIPTMTGGIGSKDLRRFYRDYFIPGNPPSLKMRLVSRTVGANRVVDEMRRSFWSSFCPFWMFFGLPYTPRTCSVKSITEERKR